LRRNTRSSHTNHGKATTPATNPNNQKDEALWVAHHGWMFTHDKCHFVFRGRFNNFA
jgi:fatty-acid desaturase